MTVQQYSRQLVDSSAAFKSMSIKFNYSKISLYTFQLEPAEKSATLIRYPVDRSARDC